MLSGPSCDTTSRTINSGTIQAHGAAAGSKPTLAGTRCQTHWQKICICHRQVRCHCAPVERQSRRSFICTPRRRSDLFGRDSLWNPTYGGKVRAYSRTESQTKRPPGSKGSCGFLRVTMIARLPTGCANTVSLDANAVTKTSHCHESVFTL